MPEPIFTVERPGAPPPPRARQPARGFAGWITALALLTWKGGASALSMLLMMWLYSQYYGWKFGVGFVFLILVHEMGHFFAAKALGIPVSVPLFIPFVGAAIIMRQHPRDAWTEARMAYAGPLAGGIGGWIALLAGTDLTQGWLIAVALFTFGMNLFNMIPIPPLDGGRICAAVSRWFWLLGLVMLGGAIFYFQAWGFLFIALLVLFMAFRHVQEIFLLRGTPAMQAYYHVPLAIRAGVAVCYLALIGVLLVGADEARGRLATAPTQGEIDQGQ